MSRESASSWLEDRFSPRLERSRYGGGMTHLRVLAPAETVSQLSQLDKVAHSAMVVDRTEPLGGQTWVELQAGNAWLITTGEQMLTGASAGVIPTNVEQPVLIELVVAPDDR